MIDFKNYERLTISNGEIKFYDGVYNKCSNQNAPEIREKINNGTLVCDIEEYQSCSYSKKQLKDMYSRLSNLEDMIEQGKLVEKSESITAPTKEQQIEEMANTIAKACPDLLEDNCDGIPCVSCLAEKLYNAGYRKKEEIEKQVAKTKTKTNLEFLKNMCPFGFMQIIFDKITEFERKHYPEFDFEISYRTENDFEEWLNEEHKE